MADQRLFFALWPDTSVRTALHKQLEGGPSAKGRRHHLADLHMTLVFLGQVREEQLLCIEQVADEIDGQRFELLVDHTGYWPKPRIVWAAPASTPQPLTDLVDGLNQQLKGCGFEPEHRPFRPHVTLYRKAERIVPWQLEAPIHWKIDEFVLASSNNPEPKQSRYRVLRRWALR
jgi:2'-5' RNA ligase